MPNLESVSLRPSFFATMTVYPTKPSHEHPPRRTIIGGYVVDDDTCCAWGSRILGIPLTREFVYSAFDVVNRQLAEKYKATFTPVGSETPVKEWMVIT